MADNNNNGWNITFFVNIGIEVARIKNCYMENILSEKNLLGILFCYESKLLCAAKSILTIHSSTSDKKRDIITQLN